MISKSIQNAIERLAKLPGIGPRHAARIAFYLLKESKKEVENFADHLKALKERVRTCPVCFLSFEPVRQDQKACDICTNLKRSKTAICVVEKETDVEAIEKTGLFKGVYHVVGENVDTLDKTTSASVKRLLDRIAYIKKQLTAKKQPEMEVILATNATTEGEALSSYLKKLIKPLGVNISRLGRGLSSGTELEYADQHTLASAFENRKPR